jgi:DNA-binding MarR family transcriptional regulator
MKNDRVTNTRKLSQVYAYTSLQMHEAIAAKAGLSGTDHKYLGFLIEKGRMTAGEFSNLTGLTTGAVTGLIDRLEKKHLVKRQFAADDRRKVFIEPNSKKIMALFVPLYKAFREDTEKLIDSFSDNEIKVIDRFLSRSVDIMKETTDTVSGRKTETDKQIEKTGLKNKVSAKTRKQ